MKRLLIILLISQVFDVVAQSITTESNNCLFENEIINSSNYKLFLDKYDSVFVNNSYKEQNDLINCLISVAPSEPKLYWYKAILNSLIFHDTSDCQYLRECIKLNYNVGFSYYNIGASYCNYLYMITDFDSTITFSLLDSLQLIATAEKNFWKASKNNVQDSYFALGEMQNLKNELLSKPLREVDINTDSIAIVAKIRDCGEFGGHFEQIIIKNINSNFFATFTADSIYCMSENPRLSENAKFNGVTKPIRKDTYNEFIQYVLEYHEDYQGITNAPFDIAIIENDKVISRNIHRYEWPHYLNFRSEVFGF